MFLEPTIKIAPKILMNEVKPIDEGTQLYYIPCFAEGIPQPEVKWESIDVSMHLVLFRQ